MPIRMAQPLQPQRKLLSNLRKDSNTNHSTWLKAPRLSARRFLNERLADYLNERLAIFLNQRQVIENSVKMVKKEPGK